jgi:hypothetical protein
VIFVQHSVVRRMRGRKGGVNTTFLRLANETGWLHTPFPATRRVLFRPVSVRPSDWEDPLVRPTLHGDSDGTLFDDLRVLAEARAIGGFTIGAGELKHFTPTKMDLLFRPKAVMKSAC